MTKSHNILVCEKNKELIQILNPHLKSFNVKIINVPNPESVIIFANEYNPKIILLNISEPSHITHNLKMNTKLYHIPVFLFIEKNVDDIELKFLSNELFKKPFDETVLIKKIDYYLSHEEMPLKNELLSQTKEKWIERKIKKSYLFEYIGTINQEKLITLKNRIEELLVIGRRIFVINLIKAKHIENLAHSSFLKLKNTIEKTGGHLKIIMHISPLTEELQRDGIDIDEYIDMNSFKELSKKFV